MKASLNTCLTLLMTMVVTVRCQLVINVSSGEPDANVYRQSVTGNLSSETVTIEFLTMAGRGIPLEVVTMLRQKHPGSVRVVEESRGHLVSANQRPAQFQS